MAGGGNAQGLELGRVDNGRERVQGELPGLQVLRDKGGTLAMADEGAGSMGKTGRDGEEEIETSDGVMGPESTGTWHGKDAAFVRAGSAGGEEGVTGGMPLDADAGGVFSLPPAVSSRQQLRALLRRQWILKKRSWCQTVFEVVSPMLMMSVLVLAYSFTTVDHYDSAEYAGSEVPFLDQLIALAQNPALVYKWCNKTRPLAEEIGNAFQRGFNASSSQADGIGGWDGSWLPGKWGPPVSEPLSGFWPPTESFPHGAGKWGPPVSEPLGAFWTPTESFPHGAGKWEPPGSEPPSGWPPTESFPRGAPPWQSPDVPQRKPQEVVVPDWAQASVAGLDTPMLPGPGFAQPSMEWRMPPLWDPDDVGSRRLPIPDAVLEEAASCIDPVVAAKQFLANFSQYNGPLPIPSLDTFVVIHRALRSAFLSKPGAYEEALHWQTSFGSILGNLLKLGKLAFSPDTPEVGLLVTYLKERYRFFANMYAGTFETVADALDFAAKLSSVGIETEASPSGEEISRELWAVVVFHKLDVQSGDVDYSIRMNYTSVPQTWRRVHRWHHGLHEAYKRYYSSGFMSLQSAINEYVLKAASGKALVGVAGNWEEGSEEESFLPRPVDGGIWGLPFPIGAYSHNMFYSAVSFVMGLLMCMSTLYPLGMLVKGIVEEKETRSRETMRIMGLRAWVLTLSWGITYLLIFAVAGLMVTVLLTGTFLPASDKSVVFVLFYLYGCSLVSFGLFMSVFFSRAKLASVVAPFAHFAALLPRYVFFRASEGQAISGKMGASLLPPTAFAFGVDLLAQYEGAGEGLTWHEVFIGSPGENGSPHHEYGMGKVLGMLTVDAILFAFLGWYLEQVLPSQYGLRRPVWFFMMPSYWVSESCWESFLVRMRHSLRIARLGVYEAVPMKDPAEHYHADGVIKCDEELEKCGRNGHRAAIQVQGLTKVYPGGKVAVEGLNLDVYEGQITALLGHNGAGKSTVISMLTGLIAPTAGEIRIWGCDIQTHQDAVRRIIGVCPQQNVLFPRLTVEEHLELYGTIKGLPRKALGLAVLEMVERVGLMDKLHTEVVDLSGGMKRKLQVALAVIGGSKVLFLDEPTSGMDPHSRRSMWTLLKSFKAGRVIVLTTHYMDEADLLSDRIAIMSEGRLMCCGSSLFLKGRYGPGYNLTMTKENSECDDNAVYSLVKKHVPESTRLICAGGEMAFKLPLRMKHKFAALFQEIEEKRSSLFIGGYGVSMTTLEEVFMGFTRRGESKEASFFEGQEFSLEALKAANRENRGFAGGQGEDRTILPLTEGNSRHLDPVHSTRGNRDGDGEDLEAGQVGGCKSVAASGHCYQVTYSYTCQRFFHIWIELLKKRAIIAKRDVKGLINSIALPVGAVAFVLLILRLNINPAGPSLDLSMEMYTGLGCKTTFTEVPSVRLGSRWPGFLGAKYLKLTVASHVNDSVSMSHELLSTLGETPRYDALIYNDTQLQKYNLSAILDFDIDRYGPFLNQLLHVDAFTKDKSKMQHKVRRDRKSVTGKNGYGMVVPLTIMHNTSSDHALPAMLTELAQAQIRALRNDSKASLKVRSHPLPLTKNEALQIQTFLTVLAALFVLIPFCYLAASFAVFVVKERTVKAKHLQLVSGVNVYEYWCAAYTWDLINYFVIASITMLVFLIYQDQAFTGTASKGLGAFLLMMLFGASSIPLSYCYSFLFKNSASAQVAIAGFHFIAGVVMLVTSFIMGEIEKTQGINDMMVHLYRLFPPFNFGEGLISLSTLDLESILDDELANPFRWKNLGRPMVIMFLEAIAFFLATLAIDKDFLQWLQNLVRDCGIKISRMYGSQRQLTFTLSRRFYIMNQRAFHVDEDVDVATERVRVASGAGSNDVVVISDLSKVFRGDKAGGVKVAVSNLSLGIPPGECFGFLGVNGAGKTTTLSILTGDLRPTHGDAFICGHSVVNGLPGAQRLIGYCPQFDPLLDLMTGREHLLMYARLKGIPEQNVHQLVKEVITAVGLSECADRVAGSYSGGNKRKLSLAIALVGNPMAIFLDEPSSGMDPMARRAMWDIISSAIMKQKMCIVLTTHSMEECEALCGRVGVMVAGQLVCLGSTQHLKSRFGVGYHLELRSDEERVSSVKTFVETEFTGAILEEEHGERLKYQLPIEGLSLSQVFGTIEDQKERIGIDDYSVSQSTLEQIFLLFARSVEKGWTPMPN